MPARGLMQAVNQVRMTNVAIVRYKRHGKRFEIACYKNKVVNWRNGVETDIDEVLQAETVFQNVPKGILANSKDLQKAFGTTNQLECCKIILLKGDFQVSDKEREVQLTSLTKDIATIISKKCVNRKTNRPIPVEVILKAMKEKIHYAVKDNKSAKQQSLDVMKKLQTVMPIERAKMRLKVDIIDEKALETRILPLLSKLGAIVEKQTSSTVQFLLRSKDFRQLSKEMKKDSITVEVLEVSVQDRTVADLKDEALHLDELNNSTEDKVKEKTTTPEKGKLMDSLPVRSWKIDKHKCLTCKIGFGERRQDMLDHYKSDLHRVNLKLKMKDLEIMTQEVFDIMSADSKNDIIFDFRK